MKRLAGVLIACALFAEENVTQPFDIDKEIDKIMHAPPKQRRILMNELKRKIFKLNLDIRSTKLLNLQKIMNLRALQHRGVNR